ncbi:MAG: acyl-CoA dehydrogenase family protein [Acidimicrobiales bacterium]
MNFAFSEEQEELRKSVRRFLEDKSPETEVRRLMETTDGYDPAVWSQMAEQLGLQSLIIPEQFGGSGFSYVELIVVLEEMGAALLCAPFFSTVALATNALLTSGDQSAQEYLLPGIASGETIATLAFTEDSGRWDTDGVTLEAQKTDDGWALRGHKSYVIDGHVAGLVLVVGRTAAGLSLFGVKGDADGLTRTALPTMDQTRKQARLEFSDTPAWLIGTEGGAAEGLTKTLDLAAVALAAEQVGGAQRCLDSAVEYAKTRIQFGRPIGSFQAIKHKCADMLLEVESAKSAAYYAGWAAAEDSDELPVVASLAKSYCSEAYFHAAAENIQIHGGIGFTWEHPAHLYFKRAKSSELMLGDPAYHRELLAQRIGI